MSNPPKKIRLPRGEGSISQRTSDSMWRGMVDVGIVNGKRRRKAVYAKTQAECVRRLREAKKDIEAGNLNTASMRVDKWLRYWLDNVVINDAKPKTLVDYRSKVENYLIPTLGHYKVDKLSPIHVRDMHRQLRERTTPKKLSETTIAHAHRVLKNSLNDAMREIGLARNVAAVVEVPGNAAVNRRGLSVPEAVAVLNTAAPTPMFSRWLAGFMTGARQGELLGLRWEHVDLDNAVAELAWSLQRVPYRHGCTRGGAPTCGRKKADRCPKRVLAIRPSLEHLRLRDDENLCLLRPKTRGSIRLVPLVPALVAALRLHQEQDTDPNPHGLVWHRPDGRTLDGREDHAAWTALLKAADVPHVTLHEQRHTTGDLLAKAKVDRQTIALVLGHSSAATSLLYTHANIEQARAALNDTVGTLLALS